MNGAPQQCKTLLRQDFGKEITEDHGYIDIVGLWVCWYTQEMYCCNGIQEGNVDCMKRTQDKRQLMKVKA
jgi:hypothetical protein